MTPQASDLSELASVGIINDQFSHLSEVIKSSSYSQLLPDTIGDLVNSFLKIFLRPMP
jgi:hypothetical protein